MGKLKIYFRHKQPFIKTDFQTGVNDFIEYVAEYFLWKWNLEFLPSYGVWSDSDNEYFKNIIAVYEDIITQFWIELSKNIHPDEQEETLDDLKNLALSRFYSFRKYSKEYWISQIKKYKRRCQFPGCGRTFLASRNDSHYCDNCRNKAHVYNNRAKNLEKRKTLVPIPCEYCGEQFIPKTKRARFCKDVCRVRAGREKIKI